MSEHQHEHQQDHQHGHQHGHQRGQAQGEDLRQMFTREFWDERYATSERIWSGRPNRRFAEQVEGLEPGSALDVGCGEGADVVWLAARGWTVTGSDVSGVALERAAAHAADEGVGERCSWLRADLFELDPLPTGLDLVTASYVHVPPELFAAAYGHLAASVAPGGRLLVLGHHPDDVHTGLRNSELSHLLFTPEAVTSVLDPDVWEVETAEVLTREHVKDEVVHTVSDTVVVARRLR